MAPHSLVSTQSLRMSEREIWKDSTEQEQMPTWKEQGGAGVAA